MQNLRDFHAHIYFNPDQLGAAQALARNAEALFGVAVGRFHERPVGPHPRGSCQLTVPRARFGEFAEWAVVNRRGLTIFTHAETGDDLADHTAHVIWFGPSEPLNLSIFR
jgi:DOPA 4,5-dioxygenase